MRVTDSTQQHNSEYRTMQTAVQLSVCQLVTLFNERPPSSISSPTPSTSRGHRSHTPALPYQYQPAPSWDNLYYSCISSSAWLPPPRDSCHSNSSVSSNALKDVDMTTHRAQSLKLSNVTEDDQWVRRPNAYRQTVARPQKGLWHVETRLVCFTETASLNFGFYKILMILGSHQISLWLDSVWSDWFHGLSDHFMFYSAQRHC